MPNSKEHIRNQALEAVEAIDQAVDSLVWRTSARIHELAGNAVPQWRENMFLRDKHSFLYILFQFCFSGSIHTELGRNLYGGRESFEEGNYEPILVGDLKIPGPKVIAPRVKNKVPLLPETSLRTLLTERQLIACLKQGMGFQAASELCQRMSQDDTATMIALLEHEGLVRENIFYRENTSNRNRTEKPLPAVPVLMN